jgi:sec-independent protein translocase protein TatA
VIGDILQPTHLLFILVIALLVLGPKRLPEVARSLGRGLRDFKSALNTDELHEQMISATSTQSTTPIEQEPIAPTATPVAGGPVPTPTGNPEPEQQNSSSETSPEPETVVSSPSPDRAS